MDRPRWSWFTFGLVLGIALGGSAVGTYTGQPAGK
jgi:hypothetical protein